MRRAVLITLSALGLVAPASALASGGPVPAVQGGSGVSAPGRHVTFIALRHGRGTLVERINHARGPVQASRFLAGAFGVPGAAYDGSTTGLSTDDRTLVLADITNVHPPRRTRLVVLDTGRLRPRARIELRGFYTVDAISPTGRWLYLIHYRSSNTNDYEVRAYDLARRRLLARPVVDPREPDEKMQGTPLTRTMTTDGRWAYTLYVRGSGALFIHALDTATRRAFCVDVPAPSGADLSTVHLALAPSATLRIDVAGAPFALMNTRTFAVRRPAAVPVPPSPHHPAASRHQGGFPWPLALAPVAALIAALLLARRRRSLIGRRPAADPQ